MKMIITGHCTGLGFEVIKQARAAGHEVYGIPLDAIRQGKEAIETQIDAALRKMGSVTHVVNNAGINHLSWIGETPEEDANIMAVNVMAPYWIVNALAAHGQVCDVVNVASATYRVPQRCTTLYCASKAALVQMTKVMARELAPQGWRVNAIAPGPIDGTDMTELVNKQVMELRGWDRDEARVYALGNIPMGRNTDTFEVAATIMSIFSMPRYVNGAVIEHMGGA